MWAALLRIIPRYMFFVVSDRDLVKIKVNIKIKIEIEIKNDDENDAARVS